MAEPRILYITGWLRSGSTVLGNVLGELPGVLHVGELHYLWRNGILGAGSNGPAGKTKRLAASSRACPSRTSPTTTTTMFSGLYQRR